MYIKILNSNKRALWIVKTSRGPAAHFNGKLWSVNGDEHLITELRYEIPDGPPFQSEEAATIHAEVKKQLSQRIKVGGVHSYRYMTAEESAREFPGSMIFVGNTGAKSPKPSSSTPPSPRR